MDATQPRPAHHRDCPQLDPSTGLPNRSAMHQRLHAGLQRGEALGLLMIDLDRFKRINDALGHSAGDQLLRLAGQRLQQALPDAELLAGVGGDEFAVLLTNADLAASTRTSIDGNAF